MYQKVPLAFFAVSLALAVSLFACSSDSSSNAPDEENGESSSSVLNAEISSAGAISSSSFAESGVSSAFEKSDKVDTDTLSVSTWLNWDVPTAPIAGTVPDSILQKAVFVQLSDAGFRVTNASIDDLIEVDGSRLTIGSAGIYVFSGAMADGQIVVSTGETSTVEFLFNGVMLGNSENSPIFFVRGDKLKMELAEGSVNIFSDARKYTYMSIGEYSEVDSVPKACIYGRDDMTIKGNGTLYVTGNYNNGIHTKADLIINDNPTIYVNAVNNAIKGKGSVRINEGGTYYLRTGDGAGISSDNIKRADKGRVCLRAGTYTMDVGGAGIKATVADSIGGGTYAIHSGADALHATTVMVYAGATFDIESGDEGFCAKNSLILRGGSASVTKSTKPFVADSGISVSGGEWFGFGSAYLPTMIPSETEFYTLAAQLPQEVESGTVLSVQNAAGTEVYSATATKKVLSVFAASAKFSLGTYSILANGSVICEFTFSTESKVATDCQER